MDRLLNSNSKRRASYLVWKCAQLRTLAGFGYVHRVSQSNPCGARSYILFMYPNRTRRARICVLIGTLMRIRNSYVAHSVCQISIPILSMDLAYIFCPASFSFTEWSTSRILSPSIEIFWKCRFWSSPRGISAAAARLLRMPLPAHSHYHCADMLPNHKIVTMDNVTCAVAKKIEALHQNIFTMTDNDMKFPITDQNYQAHALLVNFISLFITNLFTLINGNLP